MCILIVIVLCDLIFSSSFIDILFHLFCLQFLPTFGRNIIMIIFIAIIIMNIIINFIIRTIFPITSLALNWQAKNLLGSNLQEMRVNHVYNNKKAYEE